MKTLRLRNLPWFLWMFMVLECGIGVAYFGLNLLANTSPLTFILLDNFCNLIHVAMVDAIIALALYRFYHGHKQEGFACLIFFFLSLVVKEFCVSHHLDALLNLLFDGVLMALIPAASFCIFLWRKDSQDAPDTLFERGNRLVPATLFVTCSYTVVHLIHLIIEVVDFGNTYLWLLSPGEIFSIVADFLFVFAGAMLAFVTAHISMDKFEFE